MITGVMTVVVGLFGFINPLVMFLSTVVLMGFFMVMQGINIIELGIDMPHQRKAYVKIYKRKREPVRITPEEETEEKVQERLQAKREEEINAGDRRIFMRNYDICIIGGGASGLAAAASLSSTFSYCAA